MLHAIKGEKKGKINSQPYVVLILQKTTTLKKVYF